MHLLLTKDKNNKVSAIIDSAEDLAEMTEYADGSTARTHDFANKFEKKNGKWAKLGEEPKTAPKAKAKTKE